MGDQGAEGGHVHVEFPRQQNVGGEVAKRLPREPDDVSSADLVAERAETFQSGEPLVELRIGVELLVEGGVGGLVLDEVAIRAGPPPRLVAFRAAYADTESDGHVELVLDSSDHLGQPVRAAGIGLATLEDDSANAFSLGFGHDAEDFVGGHRVSR